MVSQSPSTTKPAKDLREGAPARPREAALALLVGFEDGAEDAGQVADILGDQEIVLHEALDAAAAGVVGVAHAGADLGLHVEGQALLGALGEIVQVAAHGPQEGLRPLEPRQLLGRQHAELDQLGDVVDAVDVFRDPEQRVQVAEAALALLDVGFELVAAVADPDVARVALGQLRLDELRRGAAQDLGLETLLQLAVTAPARPRRSAPPTTPCGSSDRPWHSAGNRRPSGWPARL